MAVRAREPAPVVLGSQPGRSRRGNEAGEFVEPGSKNSVGHAGVVCTLRAVQRVRRPIGLQLPVVPRQLLNWRK